MRNKKKSIFKVLKIIFATGMIVVFVLLLKGYSIQSNLFDNIQIEIKGNQFVNRDRIQENITPFLTQSLLFLSLEEIKDGISSLDFVETAQVSLLLPNTLMIVILERKPILLITLENNNFFMDKNGILIPADGNSISFFPAPIITVAKEIEDTDGIPARLSHLFQFILNEYPVFYDNLSEVIIEEEKWVFFSDSKTRIFTSSDKLFTQLNILKYFEKTVYPHRELGDYSYIDLRVVEQVVVKEKYRKG